MAATIRFFVGSSEKIIKVSFGSFQLSRLIGLSGRGWELCFEQPFVVSAASDDALFCEAAELRGHAFAFDLNVKSLGNPVSNVVRP